MRLTSISSTILLLSAGIQAKADEYAFILTGDSTTALDGGWGPGFCNDLLPGILCINTAKQGATTQSFFNDGKWNETLVNLRTQLEAGRRTFVTIQFGHNDQKVAPPETMGANLEIMVNDLRSTASSIGKGSVEPVLVTSLTRRNFNSDGSTNDILGPWVDETISVSKTLNTALIDLHEKSVHYVVAIGPDASHQLNWIPDDNTHLNPNGEIVFGRMMIDLFKTIYPTLPLPFTSDAALTYNITHGIPSF